MTMKRRLLAALLVYFVVLSWLVALAAIFVPLYVAGFRVWVDHADENAFEAVLPQCLAQGAIDAHRQVQRFAVRSRADPPAALRRVSERAASRRRLCSAMFERGWLDTMHDL